MEAQQIILWQISYAVAGFLFNLESWRRSKYGTGPLTATSPTKGMLTMLVVALITLTYPFVDGWIYRFGWIALIIRITPSGVIRHLGSIAWRQDYSGYASLRATFVALAINSFGIVVGSIGVIRSFILS